MTDTTAQRLARSARLVEDAGHVAARFLDSLAERRVAPIRDTLETLRVFEELPDRGDAETTFGLLSEYGSDLAMGSAGGRFFGLVTGGALPAAAAARALGSAWDQVAFSDTISPIGVGLEQIASRFALEILGLPETASVGLVTGATMSNFVCLAAARHALLVRAGWDVERRGLWNAPRLRVVTSEQSHVTVAKVLAMLGMGTDVIERVPCNDQGALCMEDLPDLDARTIVVGQAGNVNSGAYDPAGELCERARPSGAWVHVDGAFGLWAAASPEKRHLLAGYEAADSWAVDGHKWLNTNYDCGLAICRHPHAVHAAMATEAPYLETGGRALPKDMVPEFSRAARGIELWAALHSLGSAGVAELVEECCSHARSFASGLGDQGFEVLNDVVLNQVVATLPGHEHQMADFAQAVQASGEAWFGPTTWQGRPGIRISVSSWATTQSDVDRTLAAIDRARAELCE